MVQVAMQRSNSPWASRRPPTSPRSGCRGPGLGSPQALTAPVRNERGEFEADYIDYGFSNLAALNTKYPLGSAYTFTATASNPALSQTTTETYAANHQPTSSPAVLS